MINIKEPFEKLWTTAHKFNILNNKWMNEPVLSISAEEIEEEVNSMWKISNKLLKVFKHPRYRNSLRISIKIKNRLLEYKTYIPIVHIVCNPGLNSRHWTQINQVIGVDITPTHQTTFAHFFQYSKLIENNLDVLNEINVRASREYSLERTLKRMKSEWETILFTFVQYKDTNIYVFSSYDEIRVTLDDHISKTSTIKNSLFALVFKDEIESWFNDLVKFSYH
jgi:dynein heavy chain, axonemal